MPNALRASSGAFAVLPNASLPYGAGHHLSGDWSWVPYMGGALFALVVAGVCLSRIRGGSAEVSPHSRGHEPGPSGSGPQGSGPGGKITPEDIKAKVEELAGGLESQVRAKVPLLRYVAVGGAVVVVLAAFWLGRRSGRRRSTVVEIRRG